MYGARCCSCDVDFTVSQQRANAESQSVVEEEGLLLLLSVNFSLVVTGSIGLIRAIIASMFLGVINSARAHALHLNFTASSRDWVSSANNRRLSADRSSLSSFSISLMRQILSLMLLIGYREIFVMMTYLLFLSGIIAMNR